jgi:predicted GIY-YIG superfamily endonuclease
MAGKSYQFNNPKYIYILLNETTNFIKIGISKNTNRRIRQLELSGGCKLKTIFISDDYFRAAVIEKSFKTFFKSKQQEGEWFDIPADIAVDKLKFIINNLLHIHTINL